MLLLTIFHIWTEKNDEQVPAQLVAVVPIGSETCETRYKYGMETCNGYDIHLLHIVVMK